VVGRHSSSGRSKISAGWDDLTAADGTVARDLSKAASVLVDHKERRVGLRTRGPRRPGASRACYIAIAS
jgi:hypothetical protein